MVLSANTDHSSLGMPLVTVQQNLRQGRRLTQDRARKQRMTTDNRQHEGPNKARNPRELQESVALWASKSRHGEPGWSMTLCQPAH